MANKTRAVPISSRQEILLKDYIYKRPLSCHLSEVCIYSVSLEVQCEEAVGYVMALVSCNLPAMYCNVMLLCISC